MTTDEKRARLLDLMENSGVDCDRVATLLNRTVATIYAWRSESDARTIPDHALELLEHKLGSGESAV